MRKLWKFLKIIFVFKSCIKNVKKLLKKDTEEEDLSFLDKKESPVDEENQLRFEILKDIYITLKTENEELRNQADKRAKNQKIMEFKKCVNILKSSYYLLL